MSKIENEKDNCDLRMQSGTDQQLKGLSLTKWAKQLRENKKKLQASPWVLNKEIQERYLVGGLHRDKKPPQ
jgi:hypothetical protein